MRIHRPLFLATMLGLTLTGVAAHAEDYVLTIKDHQFSPAEMTIPANQKIKIIIKNLDSTPAEFESHDLNREKVVPANGQVSVFIGPLDPQRYDYVDDFHRDTTKGVVVAQ